MTAADAFGLPIDDPALAAAVTDGMERVEKQLEQAVDHVDVFIAGAARHLLEAGGKRFRPLLTVLSAQLGPEPGPVSDDVVRAAVVVELTHLASLYHDDVMDEAMLRRGADSANARWGNTVAILTGDLLFARASQVVTDLGVEAVRVQAETFEVLCAGQTHETIGPPEGADPVEHYLTVLGEKTGSLIATAGRFGARFGGADDAVVEVMRRYGERIGVAFQLADDLIDLASESAESGKTPGTDLREGVPTLPVLLARRSTDPADARLLELLDGDLHDDARHAEALELLRAHPAMTEAREVTRQWADDARAALSSLPEGPITRALAQLAHGVVERSA
ncbi:polyprenyl synthetase family protein [Angustibacter aerolatus]